MIFILLSIGFPMVSGLYLLARREFLARKSLLAQTGLFLAASAAFFVLALWKGTGETYVLCHLTEKLALEFAIDRVGIVFAALITVVFLCAGCFCVEYMKREAREKRCYGFLLLTLGVLYALCYAGNLITFYFFYEFLTLCSLPLVLHEQSHEAVMAGLKYLFYSLCGAYLVLAGLYFVQRWGVTLRFTPGGTLGEAASAHSGLLLTLAFLMIVGFGVKAGMFPLHAWLPTAHPVAPAPASAVLSAAIAKAGVLGIVRTVYYIFGADFLRGTWVQTAWLTLSLITVFMGSVLAYREDVLKKRLAYSTVSQISYILFGLALMNRTGMEGGFLQLISHGLVKAALFLCAGAIILRTGETRVSKLWGLGRRMPVLMWCYTVAALGLIGIPPTGGFVSKWYLAAGALRSGLKGFSWIGPVTLLVSALLTAGYLLPLSLRGFFPGDGGEELKEPEKLQFSALIDLPVLLLTVLSVLIGVWPGLITGYLGELIGGLVNL